MGKLENIPVALNDMRIIMLAIRSLFRWKALLSDDNTLISWRKSTLLIFGNEQVTEHILNWR